ncbi:hypothetical protein QVD17_05519 [Tagetes erecta]|uniref:Uncharacterized protein n=1 Tax=Tagetes erecta TaxID=13708 RepID=A0AAD8PB78_TARER|nr:hypothetical protein QVD17_05519 [Tagetes erecta]
MVDSNKTKSGNYNKEQKPQLHQNQRQRGRGRQNTSHGWQNSWNNGWMPPPSPYMTANQQQWHPTPSHASHGPLAQRWTNNQHNNGPPGGSGNQAHSSQHSGPPGFLTNGPGMNNVQSGGSGPSQGQFQGPFGYGIGQHIFGGQFRKRNRTEQPIRL